LNRATRRGKGIIAINPNVGVRHQGVERLVSELRGRPFDACSPPTIGTPLGYLTPHRTYREWVINAPDAVDAVVADLVDAIKRYGITFMEETVDLRTIVARMAEGKYGFRQDISSIACPWRWYCSEISMPLGRRSTQGCARAS
jgi:hypothetical protein